MTPQLFSKIRNRDELLGMSPENIITKNEANLLIMPATVCVASTDTYIVVLILK